MIPLDGKVVSGAGNGQPGLHDRRVFAGQQKEAGSYVYAGTVVEDGECVICIEKASGGGRYDRIARVIQESEKP